MQNSAVSFLTYSFSVSFFLRLRNSCKASQNLFSPAGTMVRVTDLDSVDLLLASVPLVYQTDDGSSALANCTVLADTVFLQEGDSAIGH